MATIKDVAKMAGVSVGTVSNVINGKTNNTALIEKVEAAVEALGFRPDGKARSLKSTQTYLIGLLIGSLRASGVQTLVSAIERAVQKKGYNVLVKISDNNAVLERKYIETFIQMGVDGIIVDTSVKEKKWLTMKGLEKIPVIFMEQMPSVTKEMNVVCIDYEAALKDFLKWCSRTGKRRAAVILRKGMADRELLKNLPVPDGTDVVFKITGHNAAGDGFKAAYELFYENGDQGIDAVLAGSQALAKGIFQAADILGYGSSIRYACVKNENWIEDSQIYDCIIDASFLELADTVAGRLLKCLENKEKAGMDILQIQAKFKVCDEKRRWPGRLSAKGENILRAAILDADTAKVMAMVTQAYERKSGIHIEFEFYPYHELWKLSGDRQRQKEEKLDIMMYDMMWKEDLVKAGILSPLQLKPGEQETYESEYIENILNVYGVCGGVVCGLPFLTGTQLLFYQKDLFEDAALKRQFMLKYGYPLDIPKTWDKFLDTAEFFTRKFNGKSPVKYGTSVINTGNLYNSIEFLNFLWPTGGDIIRDNKLVIDTPSVKMALEQYKRAYLYTSGNICNSWGDIAAEFKSGDTAMAVLYDSYAFGINDPMTSKAAGNVESALIPGRTPVLGGWGLGCLAQSDKYMLSGEFIKWVCGPECDQLFSVLSGISSRKNFYLNRDLDMLYPWKKDILESYVMSGSRSRLDYEGKPDMNMTLYDEILGKNINSIMKNELSVDEGIDRIQKETEKLLKA